MMSPEALAFRHPVLGMYPEAMGLRHPVLVTMERGGVKAEGGRKAGNRFQHPWWP